MTHDYERHGTTTLFAALNVLDGTVLGRCMQRHRHQEFLRFLNAVEAAVPAGKLVHAVLDNYATHKHPKVRAWLERHPRWTFHFTPTSCSWLNAVEAFFAKLTSGGSSAAFPLAGRPAGGDQPLPRRAQRRPEALRLDRRPGRHRREGPARVPSVGVDGAAGRLRRPLSGRTRTRGDLAGLAGEGRPWRRRPGRSGGWRPSWPPTWSATRASSSRTRPARWPRSKSCAAR